MNALTPIGLCVLVLDDPPPYVFLIGGLLSLFSSFLVLMASSILVLQLYSSLKELIGNDRSLVLYVVSKFLIIMLIWSFTFGLLTILEVFPFHLVIYLEKVSPTPCLVVSKSLIVASIMVLKIIWSTNKSINSFHTLVLVGSKL